MVSDYAGAMGDALDRMSGLGFERGGDGGDLANHGPMAAEALACMGFTDDVASWIERYKRNSSHYDPPTSRNPIDPFDETSWRAALGQSSRLGDWEHLFDIQLREQPWQSVLTQWWPRLLPGLLASLTHGLIRTAHAVRSIASVDEPTPSQVHELACGLAFWAGRYTHIPGEVHMTGTMDVAAAVAALPRLTVDSRDEPPPPGWSVERHFAREQLERLANGQQPQGFTDALTGLAPPQGAQQLLSDMTSTFAGIYVAHPEVSPVPLVHGVTAPAAIRLVLPHLPDELHVPSAAAMWKVHLALLLAFTHAHDPAEVARPETVDIDTHDLIARAYEHGAEHVIKLVEACLRENALRPDPRYGAAATAAIQRISVLQP